MSVVKKKGFGISLGFGNRRSRKTNSVPNESLNEDSPPIPPPRGLPENQVSRRFEDVSADLMKPIRNRKAKVPKRKRDKAKSNTLKQTAGRKLMGDDDYESSRQGFKKMDRSELQMQMQQEREAQAPNFSPSKPVLSNTEFDGNDDEEAILMPSKSVNQGPPPPPPPSKPVLDVAKSVVNDDATSDVWTTRRKQAKSVVSSVSGVTKLTTAVSEAPSSAEVWQNRRKNRKVKAPKRNRGTEVPASPAQSSVVSNITEKKSHKGKKPAEEPTRATETPFIAAATADDTGEQSEVWTTRRQKGKSKSRRRRTQLPQGAVRGRKSKNKEVGMSLLNPTESFDPLSPSLTELKPPPSPPRVVSKTPIEPPQSPPRVVPRTPKEPPQTPARKSKAPKYDIQSIDEEFKDLPPPPPPSSKPILGKNDKVEESIDLPPAPPARVPSARRNDESRTEPQPFVPIPSEVKIDLPPAPPARVPSARRTNVERLQPQPFVPKMPELPPKQAENIPPPPPPPSKPVLGKNEKVEELVDLTPARSAPPSRVAPVEEKIEIPPAPPARVPSARRTNVDRLEPQPFVPKMPELPPKQVEKKIDLPPAPPARAPSARGANVERPEPQPQEMSKINLPPSPPVRVPSARRPENEPVGYPMPESLGSTKAVTAKKNVETPGVTDMGLKKESRTDQLKNQYQNTSDMFRASFWNRKHQANEAPKSNFRQSMAFLRGSKKQIQRMRKSQNLSKNNKPLESIKTQFQKNDMFRTSFWVKKNSKREEKPRGKAKKVGKFDASRQQFADLLRAKLENGGPKASQRENVEDVGKLDVDQNLFGDGVKKDETGKFDYTKYTKMHTFGLPEGAIRQAMFRDKVEDSEIEFFFENINSDPDALDHTKTANAEGATEGDGEGEKEEEYELRDLDKAGDIDYSKYVKMAKFGLPEGAVELAMERDGLSRDNIEFFMANFDHADLIKSPDERNPKLLMVEKMGNADYTKFKKLFKMRVPEIAIRQAMTGEGLTEDNMEFFFANASSDKLDLIGAATSAAPAKPKPAPAGPAFLADIAKMKAGGGLKKAEIKPKEEVSKPVFETQSNQPGLLGELALTLKRRRKKD